MSTTTLYIGNKNLSSWSMRPWLALKHIGLTFDEVVIKLDEPDTKTKILAVSPNGKVPCLHHKGLVIWDSLAIIEYANELAPQAGLLPADAKLRALVRSACAEMHSSFTALRKECPMNLKRREAKSIGSDAATDLQRIHAIWSALKSESKGPFLAGSLTMADAMFAPVVSRIVSYGLDTGPHADYIETITAWPLYREWYAAALAE